MRGALPAGFGNVEGAARPVHDSGRSRLPLVGREEATVSVILVGV
jgi:hypothetical protein